MAFDEQLRQTLEPLADRIRDEIAQQIASAVRDLSALQRDQMEAAAALARSETRTSSDRLERLLEATRSIDDGRSLTEVLEALIVCAGREAARVGILLLEGTRLRAWRLTGFGDGSDPLARIDVDVESAGALADAIRDHCSVSSHTAPPFVELPEGQSCLTVPIAMAGQVVAVLYADQGADRDAPLPGATLEVLVRHATKCLEALTAIKAARSLMRQEDSTSRAPQAT